jgi:nijmegen breakage syndrome protein 1
VAYPPGISDCSQPPSLILADVSSFGTHLNDKHIKKQQAELHHGDNVQFGQPKSKHMVVYDPVIVTMSCLDKVGKKEARNLISQLGGVIANDWRKDCSFVLMKNITVTIKVVCALVAQKHVVTVQYFSDLLKHFQGKTSEKPKPENYLPAVTESLIRPGVSFHPTAERASVFQGMTFYFLSTKQFNKLNLAVELGGGVPMLADDPKSADLDAFIEPKTVVMNPAPEEVTDKAQVNWVEKVLINYSHFYYWKRKKIIKRMPFFSDGDSTTCICHESIKGLKKCKCQIVSEEEKPRITFFVVMRKSREKNEETWYMYLYLHLKVIRK